MRFFVCSGMERAAGELFRAAETVPGVRPRWSAMVLRVTRGSERRSCFFLDDWVIYGILRASTKTNITNSIFCTQRGGLGGYVVIYCRSIRFGAGAKASVTYRGHAWTLYRHTALHRYSKSHRDLKPSEHTSQTRQGTGPPNGGPCTAA